MSLNLALSPTYTDMLVVRLAGTDFMASVSVPSEPAFPELGQIDDFLSAAAEVTAGREVQWTSLGEELDLRAEANSDGRANVRVHFGSTSDDACCWQADAMLVVERNELAHAGIEAARTLKTKPVAN